jgi:glycosyltransferase involved in cell wall biosynthesis
VKHFVIVIPTRNRQDSLSRTLKSIPIPDFRVSVVVACDGDRETFNRIWTGDMPGGKHVEPFLIADHSGSVAARNEAIKWASDLFPESGILYAVDDIVFKPGFVPALLKAYNTAFRADDGVLGIRQEDSHHPAGVGLVGASFLARYPNKALFCPEYWHFAAQEIQWLADAVGKWAYTEEVWVEHFHPALKKAPIDQTHRDARAKIQRDEQVRKQRAEGGQIWGA